MRPHTAETRYPPDTTFSRTWLSATFWSPWIYLCRENMRFRGDLGIRQHCSIRYESFTVLIGEKQSEPISLSAPGKDTSLPAYWKLRKYDWSELSDTSWWVACGVFVISLHLWALSTFGSLFNLCDQVHNNFATGQLWKAKISFYLLISVSSFGFYHIRSDHIARTVHRLEIYFIISSRSFHIYWYGIQKPFTLA
jgi:hypothetical protein